MLDFTWQGHPDHELVKLAHQKVKGQLDFINSTYIPAQNRKSEVVNLSKELKLDWLLSDDTRELLQKEEFSVSNAKDKKYLLYLLSDMIIIATPSILKKKPKYLAHIPFSRTWAIYGVFRKNIGAQQAFNFYFGDESQSFGCSHAIPSVVQRWVNDINKTSDNYIRTRFTGILLFFFFSRTNFIDNKF